MIKIRKADKKDIKTIHTLRSRSILDQCSPHYSNKQLALWTYGGISDSFILDVLENFYVWYLSNSYYTDKLVRAADIWMAMIYHNINFPATP